MAARILIVEDERDLAEVLKAKLGSAGHRCAVLTDSSRAFEFVRQKKPDLVITDVMMPRVSGYELCRKIRMDPVLFATPVLMLSAMAEQPEIEHAFDQGANDYLVKPFDPGELLHRVKDLLNQKKVQEAVNSVTGLPGREHLQQVVMNKLFRDEKIALLHVSFGHSTAYANAYGQERRDDAMVHVADMIPEAAKAVGALEVYTAHLGHFDFLICCNAQDADKLAETIVRRFDLLKHTLYDKKAVDVGHVCIKGMQHPLMHPIISIVTNEHHRFSAKRLVRVAMELSRRASENGSPKIIKADDLIVV